MLTLEPGERSVITLLLLRGAQTPGELRSRSDRLHAFADLGEVEGALASLAGRAEPLVEELERRPGQKERRWIHRLGPVALGEAPAPATSTVHPTETVLADGPAARDRRVMAAYTDAATGYAAELLDELDRKPFDRWLLERLAELSDGGPVADVGCGPGQVTAHLALAGRRRDRLRPRARDDRGSPTAVPRAAVRGGRSAQPSPHLPAGAGWSVITAWYALVHLAASEVPAAIAGLADALRPGGWLAVALHEGSEVHHVTALFGATTELDFTHHEREAIVAFEAAGCRRRVVPAQRSSPTEARPSASTSRPRPT